MLDSPEPTPEPEALDDTAGAPTRGRFASFLRSRGGIGVLIVVGVLVIVGVVLSVPASRYAVVGLIVKKDARVAIVDSSTHKPVQGVEVAADGVTGTTNAKGIATLHGLAVGPHDVRLQKQYYRTTTTTLMVPILSGSASTRHSLVATGFPIAVTAKDRISGAPLAGVQVVIGSSKSTTDATGVANIVVPVTPATQAGTATHDGYNQQAISVDVGTHQSSLDVSLTTAGTLRYLSKATGVINVMEANLDGTGATVVLAGTGSESDASTTLLTTTDWKYSALLSNRTGKRDALYILAGAGKQPVTLDASASYLTPIGWQGHAFFWEASPIAGGDVTIQAYNADSGKKVAVDSTKSVSGASNYFSSTYLQRNALVYGRVWLGASVPAGETSDLISVDTSSLSSKVVKSYPAGTDLQLAPYAPGSIYLRVAADGAPSFFSYSYSSSLSPATISDDKFSETPPTFLESPSDGKTLWAESRDGKNTIFIGNVNGAAATQMATLSDFTPYGWYGADDRYILLSKNGSELYIAPAGVPLTATNVLKVTDYHKPDTSYAGYGSGYGG